MDLLRIRLLSDTAKVPVRGTQASAGLDLSCDKAFVLQPNERRLIGTGVAMTLPKGTWGEIKPIWELAVDYGIDVMAGVVNQDNISEVKVLLINNGNRPLRCEAGDRIAQLVIQRYIKPGVMVVPKLGDTDRGDGGFGSTGV